MNRHKIKADAEIKKAHELFGDHLPEFRQYLVAKEYADSTVKIYIRCIGALAAVMQQEGVDVQRLDKVTGEELIAKHKRSSAKGSSAVYMVRHFVRYLHEHGAGKLPPPTEKEMARSELRRDYEDYLRKMRGLSESTVYSCWHQANRFLEFHFGDKAGNLSKITVTDITDYLVHVTGRKPPVRNKTLATHMRSFFRFLFQTGRHKTDLARNIPGVAQRYRKRLPVHLTPEQTELLLKSVRNGTPTSRRNYAMVLLLARLGLRPQEVIRIRIDDIDWRAGEILVRGKGSLHDRMPLPSDVGEAMVDYIRNDRVAESRVLFVSNRAPHKPFKTAQMTSLIIREAFSKSGLKPPVPYTSTHLLRHSLATNLVRKGASLNEVSNLLRQGTGLVGCGRYDRLGYRRPSSHRAAKPAGTSP